MTTDLYLTVAFHGPDCLRCGDCINAASAILTNNPAVGQASVTMHDVDDALVHSATVSVNPPDPEFNDA